MNKYEAMAIIGVMAIVTIGFLGTADSRRARESVSAADIQTADGFCVTRDKLDSIRVRDGFIAYKCGNGFTGSFTKTSN